jgi:hypothetical protein
MFVLIKCPPLKIYGEAKHNGFIKVNFCIQRKIRSLVQKVSLKSPCRSTIFHATQVVIVMGSNINPFAQQMARPTFFLPAMPVASEIKT